ncbi:hypothetical protein LAZ67_7001342 [Cordylochernes scorpioides]|uniref:Uncharacterized protein n=1 Tax=Cordylochernes scorpioides TaxID=51811 RepID=A0ABY6KMS6_9ARAC|nr:hypothetical protein LAZ67_7001342 [Cordylochernes scorpioides]
MLDSPNSDPDFMNTIITGDESWVYGYNPETKTHLPQWKHSTSSKPKKARQVHSVKVMLIALTPAVWYITSTHHSPQTAPLHVVAKEEELKSGSLGKSLVQHLHSPSLLKCADQNNYEPFNIK